MAEKKKTGGRAKSDADKAQQNRKDYARNPQVLLDQPGKKGGRTKTHKEQAEALATSGDKFLKALYKGKAKRPSPEIHALESIPSAIPKRKAKGGSVNRKAYANGGSVRAARF